MSDTLISVGNLYTSDLVDHQLDQTERYSALRDAIARNARDLARKTSDMLRGRPIVQGDEVEELKAIKDVFFPVKRGEMLGIIGRNGAVKTARLEIVSRVTEPINGRVASLPKISTSFYPELTGRENELPLFSATQRRDAATCSHARRGSKKGGD